MDKEFAWELFKDTGSIEAYLAYKFADRENMPSISMQNFGGEYGANKDNGNSDKRDQL